MELESDSDLMAQGPSRKPPPFLPWDFAGHDTESELLLFWKCLSEPRCVPHDARKLLKVNRPAAIAISNAHDEGKLLLRHPHIKLTARPPQRLERYPRRCLPRCLPPVACRAVAAEDSEDAADLIKRVVACQLPRHQRSELVKRQLAILIQLVQLQCRLPAACTAAASEAHCGGGGAELVAVDGPAAVGVEERKDVSDLLPLPLRERLCAEGVRG